MKVAKSFMAVIAFFTITCTAQADVWVATTAKILRVEMREGDLRLLMEGIPTLCGNTNNWAYASRFKPNYDGFLSALLAAKMAEKSIILYASIDTSGLCEVQAVYLQ